MGGALRSGGGGGAAPGPTLPHPLQWLVSAAEVQGLPPTPSPHQWDTSGMPLLCLSQPEATSPVQVPVISDGRGSAEQESRGLDPGL